jgi:hypothetical protein
MLTYDNLTFSADEILNIDNINAIYTWVKDQRTNVSKYPNSLEPIETFETWYGALEEKSDRFRPLSGEIITAADVNEAKRQRLAIQQAQGVVLPPDSSGASAAPGHAPPPEPNLGDKLEGAATTAVYTVGVGVLLYALYKIFD